MIYTAFCRQTNREGTTWIGNVEASSLKMALANAIDACAADWEWMERTSDIECYCLIEGDVTVALFED